MNSNIYAYERESKPPCAKVNASPSLTADTPSDYKLKFGMLNDMLDIVDMEQVREPGSVPIKVRILLLVSKLLNAILIIATSYTSTDVCSLKN